MPEAGPFITPVDLINAVAKSPKKMTPSLRRMLVAFYQRCGGPEKVGEVLGEIVMNPDTNDSTRLRAIEGVLKTTGAIFPDKGDPSDLESIEAVDAELKKLDEEENGSGD